MGLDVDPLTLILTKKYLLIVARGGGKERIGLGRGPARLVYSLHGIC